MMNAEEDLDISDEIDAIDLCATKGTNQRDILQTIKPSNTSSPSSFLPGQLNLENEILEDKVENLTLNKSAMQPKDEQQTPNSVKKVASGLFSGHPEKSLFDAPQGSPFESFDSAQHNTMSSYGMLDNDQSLGSSFGKIDKSSFNLSDSLAAAPDQSGNKLDNSKQQSYQPEVLNTQGSTVQSYANYAVSTSVQNSSQQQQNIQPPPNTPLTNYHNTHMSPYQQQQQLQHTPAQPTQPFNPTQQQQQQGYQQPTQDNPHKFKPSNVPPQQPNSQQFTPSKVPQQQQNPQQFTPSASQTPQQYQQPNQFTPQQQQFRPQQQQQPLTNGLLVPPMYGENNSADNKQQNFFIPAPTTNSQPSIFQSLPQQQMQNRQNNASAASRPQVYHQQQHQQNNGTGDNMWNRLWSSDWSKQIKTATNTVLTTLDPGMEEYLKPTINVGVAGVEMSILAGTKNGFSSANCVAVVKGQTMPPNVASCLLPVGCAAAMHCVNEQLEYLSTTDFAFQAHYTIVAMQVFITELYQGNWFAMLCVGLKDIARNFTVHAFSQPIALPPEVLTAVCSRNYQTFAEGLGGYDVLFGNAVKLHIPYPAEQDWCSVLAGMTLQSLVASTARCLQTEYNRKMENTPIQQGTYAAASFQYGEGAAAPQYGTTTPQYNAMSSQYGACSQYGSPTNNTQVNSTSETVLMF